jgi:hypothetical protein
MPSGDRPQHCESSLLESRTARLKLRVGKKPTIAPGIGLQLPPHHAAATLASTSPIASGYWTKRVALGDDHEEADGERVPGA